MPEAERLGAPSLLNRLMAKVAMVDIMAILPIMAMMANLKNKDKIQIEDRNHSPAATVEVKRRIRCRKNVEIAT